MVSKENDTRAETTDSDIKGWRRKCGCIRTSDKLKKILDRFPSAPPPTPLTTYAAFENAKSSMKCPDTCISGYCYYSAKNQEDSCYAEIKTRSSTWCVVSDFIQLVQLSVTATALAIYYLIYCYMQLVYYTLRSAIYFHNADGPMKITIAVVTLTSILVGFNILVRIERLLGVLY